MKNLMFSLAAVAFISLSSFTNSNNISSDAEEVGTVSCRWRTVYYHSNGDVSATEWIYGNCNVSSSGRLYPIR